MALVTRYFAPTASGTGDGTSVANAAALFSGGAWSTVITGFNFASDAMDAYVIAGNYNPTVSAITQLNSAVWTGAGLSNPTAYNPLILRGSDASGNPLSPTNSNWTSDQPWWDTNATLPVINMSNQLLNQSGVLCRMMSFTGVVNNAPLIAVGQMIWCKASNTSTSPFYTSTSAAQGFSFNCWMEVPNAMEFGYALNVSSTLRVFNTRLRGNPSATGGGRGGVSVAGTSVSSAVVERCCIENLPGIGINLDSTNANSVTTLIARRNTIINCGTGIYGHRTGNNANYSMIEANCVTGCSGVGIDIGAVAWVMRNRVRDNAGGNVLASYNYVDSETYSAAGTDATDYNDPTNGDYRIKDATIISKGIGVSAVTSGGTLKYATAG